MSTIRTYFREAADSYFLLITVVALSTPLILLFLLANLAGHGLSWTAWFYASAVAIGYYCLPLLLVVSVISLMTAPIRRVTVGVGIALVTLFVSYLLLDALVYRIMKFHVDPFWIDFVIRDHASMGFSMVNWLTVLGGVVGVGAIEIGIYALAKRVSRRRVAIVFPVLAMLAFAFSQIVHIVAYEWNDQRITCLTPYFPLYEPITSHNDAAKYRDMLFLADANAASASSLDRDEHSSLRYPLKKLQYDPAQSAHPPNIVLILLESWRSDCMNAQVSPNIDALGKKSSVFLNHLSSGNQTTCGVFGLFYGLHATYWKAVKANSSKIDNPALIDALKSRGYSFGIFARSHFKRHKIKDTIFRGIEVHESFAGQSKVEFDADLTRQLVGFIEDQVEQSRPFFAFAFYKSTHASYEYPPEHAVFPDNTNMQIGLTSNNTDPTLFLGRYRNAVHYNDALVGSVVDRLERLGQLDNTVIIITSDHGESFNDNRANYWGHGTNFTQYQTRVPMIFYVPDREPQRFEHRTSHIDIAPTLLHEYLGCTNDIADYSNGRILFDDQAGPHPLAIGSYFNNAFVLGDNVYENRPLHMKKYTLDNINGDAGPPQGEASSVLMEELKRFMEL